MRILAISLAAAAAFLLAGCATPQSVQQVLEQSRTSYRQVAADSAVVASAPKDVMRAGDSLERAERLAGYWGSAEDVAHYAYLSERYSAIAREHGALAAQQAELARLQLERERLQLALREARLFGAQQQGRWLEEQLLGLASLDGARGLVLSLGDVLFDAGRAELRGEANRTVLRLFRFLQLNPQRSVRIEGYTDNRGRMEDNLALSRARAQAVADVLIDLGIAAERVQVYGYGGAFPVAANASSRGRAQNRRVEIVFSDEQGQLSPLRE
ncbi:OmpA family protein [Pseudomonas stutzeri]|nr:OmpA family protein [Stutzerimonas stutzeri]